MTFFRTPRFKEAFGRLDLITRAKTDKALGLLLSNPRHPSLHLKRMRGAPGVWEARVDRDHRITLEIRHDCYLLRNIGKHDETLDSP